MKMFRTLTLALAAICLLGAICCSAPANAADTAMVTRAGYVVDDAPTAAGSQAATAFSFFGQ